MCLSEWHLPFLFCPFNDTVWSTGAFLLLYEHYRGATFVMSLFFKISVPHLCNFFTCFSSAVPMHLTLYLCMQSHRVAKTHIENNQYSFLAGLRSIKADFFLSVSLSMSHKTFLPARLPDYVKKSDSCTPQTPSPPCPPSSLCRLCSFRGWTTERDNRPQSGWARSTTMACLPACLHIVHTSVGEGRLPFCNFFCTCCQTLKLKLAWVSANQEIIKTSQ